MCTRYPSADSIEGVGYIISVTVVLDTVNIKNQKYHANYFFNTSPTKFC